MLTAATLLAGGGGGGGAGSIKPGAATATKTTPTPGQSTESDLKKAISIQLQNALKLVMSQNPTALSVATSRSILTPQDGKTPTTTTLRPQSAPVTPVKAPVSSTITSSPSKSPITSSTLSPLKAGTVVSKSITAKVVASSSPRKNVSVGTSPPTSVVAVTLQAAKPKSVSSGLDGALKKSKLSAIESLLCEETLSPKSSPGPAPSPSSGVAKDEVPATSTDRTSVKKVEVSKTEMEKRQPTIEAVTQQKIEPTAAISQEIKQPDAATGVSDNKIEPKLTTDSVETKSVQPIKTKTTDSVEAKSTSDKLLSQDIPLEKKMSTETSEKKPLPLSDIKADTEAKPQAAGTSDTAMEEQTSVEGSTLKQNVGEMATNNEEMVKAASSNVEISRPTANTEPSKPAPPPSLAISTAPAPEKEEVVVKKGSRKRSPSPSLNEPDQLPPAKKQAIAPQQDVMAPSSSPAPISAVQPPSATGQAIEVRSNVALPPPSSIGTPVQPPLAQKIEAIATHKDVITPPTSIPDLPPPEKELPIEPQRDVTMPPLLTSMPTALFSASTTSTTAQASITIAGTSTVTVTVLGSSMDIGSMHGAGATSTGFGITPPSSSSSQLSTEVNTDSLIQSLCSDSTSLEDTPDVSVLASQLGIDSVDSPVFNLSGFLSLIQPDLSVLTSEEQSSALGDISSGEKQSSAITGPLLGNISSSEEQSSTIGGQLLDDVSSGVDQKPPEERVEGNTAETTTTSLPATQTLPVAVSSPLQPEVAVPLPSALELPTPTPTPTPVQELLRTSNTGAPPVSPVVLSAPVAEPITTASTSMSILSPPVLFPEEPVPPRPLVLAIPTDTPTPSLTQQAPPPPTLPLLGTPITPTPLTPTPLTPLGEGLLDLSDISSLMDESESMEGISQDLFESIEKLVNLDEQSTNVWK